ncbi:oligosaccharyltransferase complex subunit epsilon [Mucor velutinosus]|uniref:Oligosaccharyltransferase complex subunit epsilon n=1 Tax=Mucor velutinosus TaxID=708070 RepID=A0AAN7I4N3_9FUNG|nr:oligosaccharyltransferase complex subunit epsilon [Mucor velutinosus]
MTSLGRGVFVPVPTFFRENEDLDLEAFDKHIEYLANSGIAGIVVLGSMGEAVNLSDDERVQVIRQCSDSVQKYNRSLKIIAGTSSQSARNTITYTKQAAEAGAGFVLVLPPSFYKGSMDHDALYQFYTTVADHSPLPVVIYNYPGVCQGLDLSIPLLVELSKHKNIIGVKGTDGNVGKMANLVNKTNSEDVTLLAGSVDFFLPELLIGAVGLIPGAGNVFPSLCVQIQVLYEDNRLQEAIALQKKLVEADDALCRWHGIPGIKSFIQKRLGYGHGVCRNPLQKASQANATAIEEAVDAAWLLEQKYRSSK